MSRNPEDECGKKNGKKNKPLVGVEPTALRLARGIVSNVLGVEGVSGRLASLTRYRLRHKGLLGEERVHFYGTSARIHCNQC